MTTTRTRVTKADATKVLNQVKRVFHVGKADAQPTLDRRGDGNWQILWEEGPYEWVYRFPFGGLDEEMTAMMQGFKPGALAITAEARIPNGVFVEAINHYSVGIYPA